MILDATRHALKTSSSNEMYGHAAVLRRYLGVEDDRLLLVGELQHGWSPSGAASSDDTLTPWMAWSRVGAPWLYMPEPPAGIGVAPRSLLAIPGHSTPRNPVTDAGFWPRYAKWLSAYVREHDYEVVVVCLHVFDYMDAAASRAFRAYGFVVETAGHWYGNPGFLAKLRQMILGHQTVTTNAMCTAALYAAACGRPVEIAGPAPVRAGEPDAGYKPEVYDREWIASSDFACFLDVFDAERQHEIAVRELGPKLDREAAWGVFDFALVQP